jgi:sugar lactone lactonase YvrE
MKVSNITLLWISLAGFVHPSLCGKPDEVVYRSPNAIVFSPDGRQLAVSDTSADEVVFVSVAEAHTSARAKLPDTPGGVA